MERRIETGDLRQVRPQLHHGFDCLQVVRLVQRHQRNELLQFHHDSGINQRRFTEPEPAVNHTVTYGEWHQSIGEMLVSPMRQLRERFRMPEASRRIAE
jgi:hypothetical protein